MPDPDVLDRLFGELASADLPVPAPARILARGRQRRRRARGRAVIAAAAGFAVIVVGVTQFTRIHQAAPIVSQHTQPAVCAAAPNAALNAELRHALPASAQRPVSVIGLSANHAVLYLMTTTAGFREIAAESVATGAITQNLTPFGKLPTSVTSAAGGIGPNGEVVWTVTSSLASGPSTSTVWVWSPRTLAWDVTRHVAVLEPAAQHGGALSPPVFSGRFNHLVAWEAEESTGNSFVQMREILEADLLTGVTDVVATGYVGAPVFVGSDLVWPVASSANGPTHLVAVRASAFPARHRVAVPLPLRKAGPAAVIASSGGAVAYASAGLTRLFYSPSLSQPAREVLGLTDGNYLVPGGLAVGPGYLAWDTTAAASFVASARSLAAARITDGAATWGGVQGVGGDVLATSSAHPKSGPRSLYLLGGSVIDRLTCARPGRAPG